MWRSLSGCPGLENNTILPLAGLGEAQRNPQAQSVFNPSVQDEVALGGKWFKGGN